MYFCVSFVSFIFVLCCIYILCIMQYGDVGIFTFLYRSIFSIFFCPHLPTSFCTYILSPAPAGREGDDGEDGDGRCSAMPVGTARGVAYVCTRRWYWYSALRARAALPYRCFWWWEFTADANMVVDVAAHRPPPLRFVQSFRHVCR